MSADKNKSLRRRVNLLAHMVQKGGGHAVHCLGGIAHNDPEVQRLLKDGHVVFRRIAYSKVWARDLSNPADLRMSFIKITDKGRAFLQTHRHLVEIIFHDLTRVRYPRMRQGGRIVSYKVANDQTENWAPFVLSSNPRYPYVPAPVVTERWDGQIKF